MTGEQMGQAFVRALPDMLRFRDKFQAPFLATVTRSGRVSIYATFQDLIKKVREESALPALACTASGKGAENRGVTKRAPATICRTGRDPVAALYNEAKIR
jgi:hypothetical protein